jgi:lipid II:glycine glycyltransferase (peptidoglycan interpeptide bridge formation enzyme)
MYFEEINNQITWDNFVKQNNGHPLQLFSWGELKSAHGWKSKRIFIKKDEKILASAQILIKNLPKPFRPLFYIPRGPVISSFESVKIPEILKFLANFARNEYVLALKIEPNWPELDFSAKIPKIFKPSKNTILMNTTAWIDLSPSDDEIKSNFSKKTRQYINKSARIVEVRKLEKSEKTPEMIAKILEIYKETATRANFALHDDQYYEDLDNLLGENSVIYLATEKSPENSQEIQENPENSEKLTEKPLAFLWNAVSPEIAFELYGGMTARGEELRANYILKSTAIFDSKSQNIKIYDLNGLVSDGVSRFKAGFAPNETQLVKSLDFPVQKSLYFLWETLLPSLKKLVRFFKKS